MDEYMKLNWFRNRLKTEKEKIDYFSIDFTIEKDDIFHQTLNEIDSIHEIAEQNTSTEDSIVVPIDPRTMQKVENLVIDTTIKSSFFSQFPVGSCLSKAEHKSYMDKLTANDGSLDGEVDGAISAKLETERTKFNEFTKNYFLSNLLHRKQILDEDVHYIGQQFWRNQVKHFKDEESYEIMASLSLDVEEVVKVSPKLVKHLKEYGDRRQMNMEALLTYDSIRRNKYYSKNFCMYSEKENISHEDGLNELLYSDDIDYCIPVKSMCLLMQTLFKGENSWYMPLIVDEVSDRKIISVRKTCPPLLLNTTEINRIVFKAWVSSFAEYNEKLDPDLEISGSTYNGSYRLQSLDEFLVSFKNVRDTKLSHCKNQDIQQWTISYDEQEAKILIENDIDCWILNEKLNLSTKVEYQSEFGLEKMTEHELIEEWCMQYFNPGSRTLRLRIDYISKSIISHRYLTLLDIEKQAKKDFGMNIENLLFNLLKKIEIFKNFPCGKYLLKFEPKKNSQIMIYKNSKSTVNSFNLKSLYENIDYERITLDDHTWNPIDPFELAPYHKELAIIPCTFPHWLVKKSLISRQEKPMMKAETAKKCKEIAKKQREKKFKTMKKSLKRKRRRAKKDAVVKVTTLDSINDGQLLEHVF